MSERGRGGDPEEAAALLKRTVAALDRRERGAGPGG